MLIGSGVPTWERDVHRAPRHQTGQHPCLVSIDGDIYVKLGDFGLSRDSSELMTICGTQTYIAPEIYSDLQRDVGGELKLGYTSAVDIWSLDVVACELIYGLPRYKDQYRNNGITWCKKIVTKLQTDLRRRPNDLGQFLLNTMVILVPESRFSASDCYDLMAELLSTEEGYFHTSTLASYPQEDQENYGAEDPGLWSTSQDVFNIVKDDPEEVRSVRSTIVIGGQTVHPLARRPRNDSFLEDYTADPFNPLYVGSSLAPQLGERVSKSWASGFSQGPTLQDQTWAADAQTGPGSRLARSNVPRCETGGRHRENEISITERGNSGVDDYEEMAQAAFMLQAIGQDFRAP
ncbi:DNA damage response protein kinase DUN1 [Tolypocladium ophioglossoides CBS 100239]|uniref:non-specific serine/threonine protein kinase n=1 Tax=Tolypocladium ophioglossoides (strain CBS 100239) TaxID=1163406 RepID=A0A0L0NGB6_TOLOC|nr:DNA damage response protein kinase DUN1 [Tolypocladium ophioglossoides CBS 100239]